MAKVCPQRIIATAVEYLDKYLLLYQHNAAIREDLINNIGEMESLSRALQRDGIISIEECYANHPQVPSNRQNPHT